jgi:hypothetical protein
MAIFVVIKANSNLGAGEQFLQIPPLDIRQRQSLGNAHGAQKLAHEDPPSGGCAQEIEKLRGLRLLHKGSARGFYLLLVRRLKVRAVEHLDLIKVRGQPRALEQSERVAQHYIFDSTRVDLLTIDELLQRRQGKYPVVLVARHAFGLYGTEPIFARHNKKNRGVMSPKFAADYELFGR